MLSTHVYWMNLDGVFVTTVPLLSSQTSVQEKVEDHPRKKWIFEILTPSSSRLLVATVIVGPWAGLTGRIQSVALIRQHILVISSHHFLMFSWFAVSHFDGNFRTFYHLFRLKELKADRTLREMFSVTTRWWFVATALHWRRWHLMAVFNCWAFPQDASHDPTCSAGFSIGNDPALQPNRT